ncbi:MAG: FAD-dependent oxidoreductase, partial [Nitrospira sp.]|nr:FAD-dependent oxidoreductase [Nitrospira sp.]
MGLGEGLFVLPDDEHDQQLIANVAPSDWINPQPQGRYNIAVLGAGTAGLITAIVAASLGAKVALIEKRAMGGDCLNVGCVPSKSLLRAARAWADLHRAKDFGIHVPPGATFDFGSAMARMRRLRARISRNDSVHRYTKLGVDVYLGTGRLVNSDSLLVEGPAGERTIRFLKAAICTGARPSVPPIPGLLEAGYLTNETVFSLTEPPRRLGIIGTGPVGCELAQAFARFGSQVYLIESLHGILPKEDRDAAEILHHQLVRDGVQILCCSRDLAVEKTGAGKRLVLTS